MKSARLSYSNDFRSGAGALFLLLVCKEGSEAGTCLELKSYCRNPAKIVHYKNVNLSKKES